VAVNRNFTGASARVALASGTLYQRTVGADGTLYDTRYSYDSTTSSYTTTFTVIDPDDPAMRRQPPAQAIRLGSYRLHRQAPLIATSDTPTTQQPVTRQE
jgi:hypothetical protein